jgi:hypothetical protein
MQVRCKMQLVEIRQRAYNKDVKEFVFCAQYDESIPEDRRFAKASPSAEFRVMIDNPVVSESYELGGFYYFDSIPVQSVNEGEITND